MRAVVAPMIAERSFFEAIPGLIGVLPPELQKAVEALRLAPGETSIANMRAALKAWTLDREQVRLAVAPTIPHHCSDAFIRACVDVVKEHGVGLHSHVAESKVQAMVGLQWYGKTATAQLDALGALGPHFTVARGVWLDDDDMRRLGDRGASIAHNPGSNMRLGNGFGDMHAMLARRVNVGIGTDGANCSDNQNVYEALRLAALVSKGRTPDVERWVTTEQAALAVTEGGARALGFEGRLGRLAPGYKADIVFLDLGHPNWIPLNDPTNQLVHTEDRGAAPDAMIGGRPGGEDHPGTTGDPAPDHHRRAGRHRGRRHAAAPQARPRGGDAEHPAAVGLTAGRYRAPRFRDPARLRPRGPGDGHGDGGRRHRRPLSDQRPVAAGPQRHGPRAVAGDLPGLQQLDQRVLPLQPRPAEVRGDAADARRAPGLPRARARRARAGRGGLVHPAQHDQRPLLALELLGPALHRARGPERDVGLSRGDWRTLLVPQRPLRREPLLPSRGQPLDRDAAGADRDDHRRRV